MMEKEKQQQGFTIYLEGHQGHHGNVLAHAFVSKVANLINVLGKLERAYLGVGQRKTDFEIIGAEKVNPTSITLKPVPKAKNYNPSPALHWGIVQMRAIAKGEDPDAKVRSDIAQDFVRLATHETQDGYRAFWINGYTEAVRFDDDYRINAEIVAKKRLREDAPTEWRKGVAHGVIVGELKDVLDSHGEQQFAVVPKTGPDKVVCTFPEHLRPKVQQLLFSLVRVEGRLHYAETSPFPYAVVAEEIDPFPPRQRRRTLEELRGVFANQEKPVANWDHLLNGG